MFLAIGIVLYFARSFEPSVLVLAILLIIGLLGIIALICLGFACAGYRVHIVKSTVLKHRDYGPIEGQFVGIDKSVSSARCYDRHNRISYAALVSGGMGEI